MDLKLKGKRAFISGSTQGIGFAIAQHLLAEAAEVIINGRDQVKMDKALTLLKGEFPDEIVSGIAADFSDKKQVESLLERLSDIDILINNVGIFELKDFTDITDEDWRMIFDINVMSGVSLSRKLLPEMLKKNWGRVLFISSESGINIPENMIHYGMTKAAMMAISNGLSKLTRGSEVTVNSIVGGPTYSDGVAHTIEHLANMQNLEVEQLKLGIMQHTNPHSLIGRFIQPSEIAHLAAYLASPLSLATNGACLRADGGVLKIV